MELQLKHVPVGSIVELGGDTEKRRFYLGELHGNGYGLLWPSQQHQRNGKPWLVMATPESRIKNVQLPHGFDKEKIVGWARELVW